MSYSNEPPKYPPPPGYPQQPAPYAPRPGSGKDGMATASLAVGVVSLVSICGAFIPFLAYCAAPLAFLTGVAGIILGFIGLGAPQKSGLARIGLVLSGSSVLLQICFLVVAVVIFGSSLFLLGDPVFLEDLLQGLGIY
jgi:hypothetical protein